MAAEARCRTGWRRTTWPSSTDDDLLSFLIFDDEEELSRWAEICIQAFEDLDMKANIGKLELLVMAYGPGAKAINDKVAKGKFVVKVRQAEVKAKLVAKYLGAQTAVDGTATGMVNDRL